MRTELKPGLFEEPEVFVLEACLVSQTPDGIVAYDIYASAKPAILFEGISRTRLAMDKWCNTYHTCHQDNDFHK